MSNILAAMMFGAGGAMAYQYWDVIKEVMAKGDLDMRGTHLTAVNSKMSKEMEELRKILLEQSKHQQHGVTVVHSGGKQGTALIMYPTLALAAYLAYLRLVKGYKLVDLMYVSKAALQQSVGQVKGHIVKVKEQMENIKVFLQKQMDQLSEAQKQLMSAQEGMSQQLSVVDQSIYETKAGVDQVSGAVRQLDDRMIDVSQSQQYTERGVYVLCHAVQEIMYLNGTPSKHANDLSDFLSASPPLRIRDGQQQQQLQNNNNNSSLTGLQGLSGLQSQTTNGPVWCLSMYRTPQISGQIINPKKEQQQQSQNEITEITQ
eukprot:TRINITY_DN39388_c0_g1_i1.p1 TRINITY_DN39388_c0_g1~~TRINITY_DN39388_c0_g1_i1.p1  ORF type:complete len:316 (-),score=43.21 TRINITY_DN39388_c0_g1_i1:736-1683(-)